MRMQRVLAAGAASLFLAAAAVAAVAAQDGGLTDKLRSGTDVSVATGETIDHDLYAFGGRVTIDGTINGDLVASGGLVVVAGTVTGDVIAAGGTVDVRGQVNGDVRLAGGAVRVDGGVTEDVLAAGGQVRIASNASVGEDVFASAGQLSIDGTVQGSVRGGAGTYTKSGTIGGTEDVTITPQAQPTAENRVLDAVRYVLAVVALGVIALWAAPRLFRRAETVLVREPATALGWGLLSLVGWVVAIVLVAITVLVLAVILGLLGFGSLLTIAIAVGVVVFLGLIVAFAVLAGFVADAVVGFAAARAIAGRGVVAEGDRITSRDVWLLIVGAAIVAVLASLPVVGPVIKLVAVLLGLGAIAAAWWSARRRRGGGPATAEPVAVRPTA
jgi:cytoskeletal protein CcmA (bactofilin family)